MRCHFSIIFEQTAAFVLVIFMLIIGNLDEAVQLLAEGNLKGAISTVGVGLLVLIFIVGRNTLHWYKTFIRLEENALIIDKQLLSKTVNTIGIKNISNVNLEQNLFERLVGTYRVKIDTNSMTTADKTDVEIVLKKDKALWLKSEILKVLYEEEEVAPELLKPSYENRVTKKELFMNGLCSTSILAIICALLVVLGTLIPVVIQSDKNVAAIILSLFLCGGVIWPIIKPFFNYYGFHVVRDGDKLHLQQGFLKIVNYTIPVDKINAIYIKQSFLARLFKRYIVELVNVGVNDEKGESGNRLILASTKEEMEEKLKNLLPEFAHFSIESIEKQPKTALNVQGARLIVFGIISLVVFGIVYVVGDMQSLGFIFCGGGLILLFLILIINMFVGYYTKGVYMGEDYLLIAKGIYKRQITYVDYKKIQYTTINSSLLASRYKLAKAKVYILAGSVDKEKVIPYVNEVYMEKLVEKLLD